MLERSRRKEVAAARPRSRRLDLLFFPFSIVFKIRAAHKCRSGHKNLEPILAPRKSHERVPSSQNIFGTFLGGHYFQKRLKF